MNEFKRACEIISENDYLADFVGGIEVDIIKKAEQYLEIKFPEEYKQFLLIFGSGNFGSEEIYGIVKDDFVNSGVPDAIWITCKQRKENKLPQNYVIIYFTGDEEYYCLDISESDGVKCPIISINVGCDFEDYKAKKVFNSFSEFFLEITQREV